MPEAWSPDLVASSESWFLRGGTRTGGQSFLGQEQLVTSPTARWTATLTIPLGSRAKILAFNALMGALNGRVGTVLVPMNDLLRAPLRAGVRPFYDARLFRTAADAAMNATTLQVARQVGGAVLPGQHFTVDGRLYRVVTAPGGDTEKTVDFPVTLRPWLRADVEGGTFVDFARPACTMRLASDDTGKLELQLARFGTVTLDFIEAF